MHQHPNKPRGFTTLNRQPVATLAKIAQPQSPAKLEPAKSEPVQPLLPVATGPVRPPKLPRGNVPEWGTTLAYLPRGPEVRLRVAVERWSHAVVLTVVEWRLDGEGWYPRRSRCAAFEIAELDQIAALFDQAKAAAKDLGPEVSGAQ